VPVAWFDLAYSLARSEGFSPPVASRVFGYLGVSLYESLVPGMPGYQSLAGQLNGLEALPRPAGSAYHWPTVANSVLAETLSGLVGKDSVAAQESIQALSEKYALEFKQTLPPGLYERSIDHGQKVGREILEWAAGDGYELYKNCPYAAASQAGEWQPTPPGYAPPLLPCWGKLRPFIASEDGECTPGSHPIYSQDPQSDFYQEAWEVYEAVNQATPEQIAIVHFWADNPRQTGTPSGHSISILSQILVQKHATLDKAAEAYARVGIAVADSFISCWKTKYEYNLLRPITYIHSVIGDRDWNTLVTTPPFPEYTSGHSVQSAAAAEVLAGLFGEVAFTDHTHDSLGYAPRTFTSFYAFAEEAAVSRLYGGIHYRAAIENGLAQGTCIGQKVNALQFKKTNAP
jgi:hypothetical protein